LHSTRTELRCNRALLAQVRAVSRIRRKTEAGSAYSRVDNLSPATDTFKVRIIKTSTLRKFWRVHAEAEASLRLWIHLTKAARWLSFSDVRRTFPSADRVTVASGRSVIVFNIAHNRYRLIAAVQFNRRIVYTLMVLTHKQYDRGIWKDQL
jgi:mRNA interferase HigB